ncbi:hypothetical protein A2331_00210 [Candidatus Falkowbacteria bacterium RIFOXYB2_FULL_34_18]|uniref:NADH-ubiquinone oxidoreductase 51kDa subunit iron-sulphur binding domain-containing protein n=1 Tax=Candidatus Falkowbacteria bacterium RIFOXYD2_FULL_34_120 TaxID=1798007 RepID=A0A1F5TSN8_9BACT|nr:MAG: hypothetical protein A2331_00210 [Candidatus Falkowbacteria bacterium RIFOXYB2_FULL_34_18]OGF29754.1 MAG: hypothetical protein A2500_01140 [Candidatus Falkowbacteria bacterium RIFOXYC12_FULL_34_55]OGF37517.1 MAG: hypothetical protein A2466_00770 [Candidatus Falkowbacteria bacterium RIFOXYC2_FULL_34_220]OGF39227.1 MAG: hypothetical protein A2515_01280 [Candidatus Falkowbacteria bacterium RIFOXYD12_FULL_34_57]OGF41794.1 MAG: hypothetical protein A2531_05940 [Candidatus Falkowbacteria bact
MSYETRNIINKIKKANLTGRGGASFPTALKWEMVKKARGKNKYVICNVSEGEPGIQKDYYILQNYLDTAILGMETAIEYLKAEKAIIYINKAYFKKFEKKLNEVIRGRKIEIFEKEHDSGYIGGEETSAINSIEGCRVEPRLRPPFPPTCGIFNSPTLVNNLETFYDVGLIVKNKYHNKRLVTINGDCLWTGVYAFDEEMTVEDILRKTENYPKFTFFVQIGGDAAGVVLNSNQLDCKVCGGASVTVYSVLKHEPFRLMKEWVDFFVKNSCGQCTPCREGTLRLQEILISKDKNWTIFSDILTNLPETSFCGLGSAASIAVTSYIKNVLLLLPSGKIKIPEADKKMLKEVFSL